MDIIKIKFDSKTYYLKPTSYRAIFLYEEMTGDLIGNISTFKQQVQYLYCLFKASNDDFDYTFEEFVDILEANPEIFQTFISLNESKKK